MAFGVAAVDRHCETEDTPRSARLRAFGLAAVDRCFGTEYWPSPARQTKGGYQLVDRIECIVLEMQLASDRRNSESDSDVNADQTWKKSTRFDTVQSAVASTDIYSEVAFRVSDCEILQVALSWYRKRLVFSGFNQMCPRDCKIAFSQPGTHAISPEE